MASTQVNPTRMELTKQKKKLVTAVRGHKLLKDKRDELMRQFLDLVRENMELRKKVEAGIRSANTNFVIAKASDLDGAVKSLADILPDMLRLAEVEKACQLMASEIEKTRRRVNALEHVIIPEAQANIKYITMKLDENERSTQIRLMKVKDMMLEEAHHYKEREAERGA